MKFFTFISLFVLVGAALAATVNIIDIYKKVVFDYAVLKNPKPVIVFYYTSSGCTACKWSIRPMLEKMVKKKSDSMYLAIVDFDVVPELQQEHGITEIPTTRVYYKGELMDSVEGLSWAKLVPLVNGAARIQSSTK